MSNVHELAASAGSMLTAAVCTSNIAVAFPNVLACAHRLAGSAGSTLVAFVIGAIGTVAGTLVAWLALGARLGPDGWKVGCL